MRKIYILRAILEFMLYFLLLGGVALLIITPFILTDSDWDIPIKINGVVSSSFDSVYSKIGLGVSVLSYFLFVYAIYLLKKTVNLFIKGKVFDNQAISNLSNIGKIFIIVTLIINTVEFIFKVTTTQNAELMINSGFDSFLFVISIGLFFIIISEVFKIAKNMKDENELTI
ncbi:MAG TPA: DUF2975 domain-containing protein [Flavobacterium sp.]|nr:DUF2975 domain-containing protein [Flavobacterium sp.]